VTQIARVAVVLAVLFGFGATLPEVAGALGAT
jgi:Sec-independent protein translocase protein TatA